MGLRAPLTNDEIAEVLRLRKAGFGNREIAGTIGKSYGAVSRVRGSKGQQNGRLPAGSDPTDPEVDPRIEQLNRIIERASARLENDKKMSAAGQAQLLTAVTNATLKLRAIEQEQEAVDDESEAQQDADWVREKLEQMRRAKNDGLALVPKDDEENGTDG